MFFHAAQSHGNTNNCWGQIFCKGYPFEAKTIESNLGEEGYKWEVHWMDWNESFAISPMNKDLENQVYDPEFKYFFKQVLDGTLSDYTFLIPKIGWS